MIDHGNIDKIFQALDRQIELQGGTKINLVVCGGTALAVLGLVSRTTKDVDVLATLSEEGGNANLIKISSFPEWFSRAAEAVQRDFGLSDRWINLGPASQLDMGLPEGFSTRLIEKRYGDHLKIFYTCRLDQIHFKLFAALDQDSESHHYEDLLKLSPREDELGQACSWVLQQDVSEEFRYILKDFLIQNGYESLAEKY